jgi:hypothetical protein
MSDWLREKMDAEPYVPDGGFTERVLGALPTRRERLAARLRAALLGGCAAVAALIAIVILPSGAFVGHALHDLAGFHATHGAALPIAGVGLLLVLAASAAAALTDT